MAIRNIPERLRELKENWDGDGAPVITEEAIEMATRILKILREEPGQSTPLNNGGIQLEWHSGGVDLEIAITPEGTLELE